MADKEYEEILKLGGVECAELLEKPGFINLVYEDIYALLKDAKAVFKASGRASGADKAEIAAKDAFRNLSSQINTEDIKSIIISMKTGSDFPLFEMNKAAESIANSSPKGCALIWGHVIDEDLDTDGGLIVTIIAAA